MIGAAMGTVAPAVAPPPSGTAPADAAVNANADTPAGASGNTPAPQDPGASATAGAKPKSSTPSATDAPPADAPKDFDALLAAQGPADATASPPTDAARAPATSPDSGADTAPVTPDQLLALLAGCQAISATPTNPATPQLAPESTDALRDPRPMNALSTNALSTSALPTAALPLATPPGVATNANATPATDAASTAILATTLTDVAKVADSGNADGASAPMAFDGLLTSAATPATSAATGNMTASANLASPIAMPVDPDAGFDDGFGARIGWMAEQKIGHAEIRISPDNLGPIDVRVQVDGTRVTAEFHSAHADVRQALEASVPRLRELLGQQGLQLGRADVGQRRPGAQPAPRDTAHAAAASNDDAAIVTSVRTLRSRGLVDEYA